MVTNRHIGSPVERVEDLRFLRGRGEYIDDVARSFGAQLVRGLLLRPEGFEPPSPALLESDEEPTDAS